MKTFLKYTLATIVGILIINIIGFLIMMGVIGALVASSEKETVVQENSMLQIKLDAQIVDRGSKDPFQNLEIPVFAGSRKLGLDQILSAIDKAKSEDKIKGIFLRIDDVMAGFSACEEIRRALVDFKESGKFIYAYSEVYSQKAYYLASAADKVFINPEGMIQFSGLASNNVFFKNALEKLGIEMQIIRHGKFKAAVEPFMLDKMSPENREQVSVYMGSIWNSVLEKISASRDISIDELNRIADENMSFRPAENAYAHKLVDSVLFEDQVLDILRGETGIKAPKGIPVVSITEMESVPAKREHKGLAKEKLALIYASGEIGMEGVPALGDEAINAPEIAREIRQARQDSSIKAIVLRVNSPGGSSLASELIWREVKLAAETKTLVVSMGNLAASGGYYISCAADTIVANPTTLTGSIGVFGVIPNTQELFEDKLGINFDVVKTNKLSDMPSANRRLTETERALMQSLVEDVYTTFVNHVAEGRGMTYEQVDAIGEGRVWTGENALDLGLVDVLGNLDDAVELAKKMAGLDHCRIVKLPKQKDPIEELLKGFSTRMKMNILEKELGTDAKYYHMLQQMKDTRGIMARIPYGLAVE
ncbi:MAG TPA: signal peptide peptidase SppA [Prolixibacteraceae bacterium]|nr:signal peptide peptidase SppA [Prolixibacteraceae bacterium]